MAQADAGMRQGACSGMQCSAAAQASATWHIGTKQCCCVFLCTAVLPQLLLTWMQAYTAALYTMSVEPQPSRCALRYT